MAQQQNPASNGASAQAHPAHFTAFALRSAGQIYDINLSVARTLLRTQARAAAAFGLPDWSPLLDGADERARQVFSTGTEQMLSTAQRANDAARELQQQMGRVFETQSARAAETWQRGLEELGQQTSDGFRQLCEAARETAEQAQRSVDELARQGEQAMRNGTSAASGSNNAASQPASPQMAGSQPNPNAGPGPKHGNEPQAKH